MLQIQKPNHVPRQSGLVEPTDQGLQLTWSKKLWAVEAGGDAAWRNLSATPGDVFLQSAEKLPASLHLRFLCSRKVATPTPFIGMAG